MRASLQQLAQGLMFRPGPIVTDYSRNRIQLNNSELAFTNNLIKGRLEYQSSMYGNDLDYEAIQCVRDPYTTRTLSLLPILNPDGEDLKVYYPAGGFDFVEALAMTDGTTFVFADRSRDFEYQNRIDNYKAVIRQIISMGGKIKRDETYIPPDKKEGKATIKFWFKSRTGENKLRTLIYYTGIDAYNFIPDELKDGFDVLIGSCLNGPLEKEKMVVRQELIDLLNQNGSVAFYLFTDRDALDYFDEGKLRTDDNWKIRDLNDYWVPNNLYEWIVAKKR